MTRRRVPDTSHSRERQRTRTDRPALQNDSVDDVYPLSEDPRPPHRLAENPRVPHYLLLRGGARGGGRRRARGRGAHDVHDAEPQAPRCRQRPGRAGGGELGGEGDALEHLLEPGHHDRHSFLGEGAQVDVPVEEADDLVCEEGLDPGEMAEGVEAARCLVVLLIFEELLRPLFDGPVHHVLVLFGPQHV